MLSLSFMAAFLFCAPVLLSASDLLFEENFESSAAGKPPTNDFKQKTSNWGNCSGSCTTVTTEKARKGNKSLKTYLNRNKSKVNYRAEAVPRGEARVPKAGGEYWYGFSFYVPGSHVPDYKSGDTIAQWHTKTGHPVTLRIIGTNYKFIVRDEDHNKTMEYNMGTYEKDRWVDWVIRAKWSHKNDGLIEVWKNGNKVVTHKGINDLAEPGAPWLKIGLYKAPWQNKQNAGQRYDANITSRVFYHDEVRIVSGPNAKFADVDPSQGSSSPASSNGKVNPPKNVKITFE